MTQSDIRKGMPSREIDRETFQARYKSAFVDSAFSSLQAQIDSLAAAAWDAYSHGRKAPRTRRAGPGFFDPEYEIAVDWLQTRAAIDVAQQRYDALTGRPRVLLVNGSSRTEHTCPGEMSKSWRLIEIARESLYQCGDFEVDVLDLSRTTSEYGITIHPCKSCVSTSMALCHWPCSCYPNYSLGQVHDWMNEIYPLWVAARGIMIVTPVNWYEAPGPLKAMMDRLVCADGGNPDPSSTHGKHADEAKALELKGWPYPRHLKGRLFSAVTHGDTVGAEGLRRHLMDWAKDMKLVGAGSAAEVDGYIGYFEPYACSHTALDKDQRFQEQVRNAARALAEGVEAQLAGRFIEPGGNLKAPQPK